MDRDSIQHFELHTPNGEVAEQALDAVFPGARLVVEGDDAGFWIKTATMPRVVYTEHGFGAPGSFRLAAPEPIIVVQPEGDARITHGGEPVSDLSLLDAPRPIEAVWSCVRTSGWALDRQYVRSIASHHVGAPQPDHLFTSSRPIDPVRHRTWTKVTNYVTRSMTETADAYRSPLVQQALAHLMATTLLDTFPNVALASPQSSDVRKAMPVTVRRAMAFIDEHAHEPITVTDVAAAVHTTTRGLQAAFLRALGTSPGQRLRRVRLDGAHRDLKSAPMGSTTVAAIARRWGFANAGNFAAAYRKAFGTHPSVTLNTDP